jgi:hypothetical protein
MAMLHDFGGARTVLSSYPFKSEFTSWSASMSDEALPNSPAQVAQAAATFQWDEGKAEAGSGIALSGGGFRAMLFHAGALARMNELGLLSKAKCISSVSGGSIISAQPMETALMRISRPLWSIRSWRSRARRSTWSTP